MDTYDVHQSQEVVLHVLLAMEPDHRVVNPQQNFDVVVVVSGVPAATAALDGLIDLPGHQV